MGINFLKMETSLEYFNLWKTQIVQLRSILKDFVELIKKSLHQMCQIIPKKKHFKATFEDPYMKTT